LTNNRIINVYPNPASSSVIISINQLTNCNSQLTIADCTGKIISYFDNVSSSSEIDISFYPAGMYFITIQVKDQVETVKFMKIN
ncbi:MAG TPA: T9SS type A sorting domain-containing protein, partial [Chitinophagales bacterium]|nr:T9SS type A sorting domain-containing protein [Chitinophagales bacterium]